MSGVGGKIGKKHTQLKRGKTTKTVKNTSDSKKTYFALKWFSNKQNFSP